MSSIHELSWKCVWTQFVLKAAHEHVKADKARSLSGLMDLQVLTVVELVLLCCLAWNQMVAHASPTYWAALSQSL